MHPNEAYEILRHNEVRDGQILADVKACIQAGRTPVILSRYKDHSERLYEQVKGYADRVFLMIGNNSKKEHKRIREQMQETSPEETLALVATGSLIGEGFDFPRLDTLIMATPVSFQSVVEQYAGRLNRDYAGKKNVIVYDYVDAHIPMFDKMYLNWTENLHDWCISRQLWWGHRIPAFYCDDCGEMTVSKEDIHVCPKCGSKNVRQEEDVLDTWFSSALWPFSTLGWPEKTKELEYFYPTSTLVTGYDIIFFWVIRMVFSGYEHTGKAPFHTVLIHGLVRDSQGRKMSKSLGNGIDPLDIIDKYGADALRLTLVTGNAPGNDMRFYNERVEASRNFANKVWNASRFMLMNIEKADLSQVTPGDLTPADKWILSKANTLVKEVTDNMENYELGIAVAKLHDFIWEEFCDWYIEMVKPRLYNDEDATKAAALYTLKSVLTIALKLLHPYMPFITEEIFCSMQDEEESIMVSDWPVFKEELDFKAEENEVEIIKNAVRNIRNLRADMNVPPSKKATVYVVSEKEGIRDVFENSCVFFATLAYASEVIVQADKAGIADDAVSTVIPDAVIYIPFAELVDVEKEIARLEKEAKRLAGEIKRASGMLNNEKFISKAPAAKVEEEKKKLEKYTAMEAQVKERLSQLKK